MQSEPEVLCPCGAGINGACQFCKGFDDGMANVFFVLIRLGQIAPDAVRKALGAAPGNSGEIAALNVAIANIERLEASSAK